MFDLASDSALLDAMRDAQCGERMAFARVLLAAGRFTVQRIAASGQDYLGWCVDYWDVVAAEIAAELGVSRGRASHRHREHRNEYERHHPAGSRFIG